MEEEHEDEEFKNHVRELITQLEASGIKPSVADDEGDGGLAEGDENWEDDESDVEMG